jgi:uncharacterized membrane protein
MLSTIVNALRGALIGVAEVIPGVSGGTVALIVGIYETLIDAIADTVTAARRALGLTSEELQTGMFQVKAWTWFSETGERYLPSLIQGATVQ